MRKYHKSTYTFTSVILRSLIQDFSHEMSYGPRHEKICLWGLQLGHAQTTLLSYCSLLSSVVPRSRFLGDTSVPLPEFQRDICKFWGTHQIHLIFTCKIGNSFPEISVHFYLNLSSMSIVLAQEAVQIAVKYLVSTLRYM